jgi:hypothetical protein
MTAPLHTPGPWLIEQSDSFKRYLVTDAMGDGVASVGYFGPNPAADAQLITAAPDMKKALAGLLAALVSPAASDAELPALFGGTCTVSVDIIPAIIEARAAIALATGSN